jgi:flagellar basal body rod protein FlgG
VNGQVIVFTSLLPHGDASYILEIILASFSHQSVTAILSQLARPQVIQLSADNIPMQINQNISALKNISLAQEVSANNIANVNSNGFKASKTDQLHISPEARAASLNSAGQQMSTTEPVQDIVQMTINATSFEANVKAIQTQGDMLKAVMDIKK